MAHKAVFVVTRTRSVRLPLQRNSDAPRVGTVCRPMPRLVSSSTRVGTVLPCARSTEKDNAGGPVYGNVGVSMIQARVQDAGEMTGSPGPASDVRPVQPIPLAVSLHPRTSTVCPS